MRYKYSGSQWFERFSYSSQLYQLANWASALLLAITLHRREQKLKELLQDSLPLLSTKNK